MKESLTDIIADWTRAGAGFAAQPAEESPDLEVLILATCRHIPEEPRLFVVVASWLCRYYELIAKHRLVALVVERLEPELEPILGLLLDTVGTQTGSDHFKGVIAVCAAAETAGPLYVFQRNSELLAKIAHKQASTLSKKWNLWADEFVPKTDAIRPIEWVFEHNPGYRVREVFGGDLRASIVGTIESDQDAGESELELIRRCHASRDAIRKALDRLERYGHVERKRNGRNLAIRLARRNRGA